ncbi:MAG TPA: adenine phosphoribosyltransferase [Thermoanaerobaculia bacterium]|nr:adenine phosphoribosyltransferase [Thermoanaerobaculia bacterium]HUM28768.1 adenine phosphoribosyltransferase [Thermoanaerobaculia bacterium]HXK67982.1 adenine phosphoribosyltransferase [Thermoanaerobaculia bacterium]
MKLEKYIRDVPDFPKEGILFKDITPLLNDLYAFTTAVEAMADVARKWKAEKIVGIESRGFIFGSAVAYNLGIGFVPVRKPGKLPFTTIQETYSLEYGTDALEMHTDAFRKGERAVIIDDLLATGGTARAAFRLAESGGAEVMGAIFLVELAFLNGRDALKGKRVHTFISYERE